MTTKIAIWLALIILGCLALDYFAFEWANTLFTLRKGLELIEYITFWR